MEISPYIYIDWVGGMVSTVVAPLMLIKAVIKTNFIYKQNG